MPPSIWSVTIKASLVGAVMAVCAPALSDPGVQSAEGFSIVQQTLATPFHADTVTVTRRMTGEKSYVVMKMTVVKGRLLKAEVLQPVKMQGQSFVDDGKTLRYYDPKAKVVVQQDSPWKATLNARRRIEIARQNYTVVSVSRETVSGRDANVVVLQAKDRVMGRRTYKVDRSTDMLLHLSVQRPDEKALVLQEAISVSPRTGSADTVKLDTVPGVRLMQAWSQDYSNVAVATGLLGFAPRNAARLPYGFVQYQRDFIGSEKQPVLVSRLTDGLAIVSVYQWPMKDGRGIFGGEIQAMRRSGQAFLSIDGDLTEASKKRILEAFTGD